MDAINKIKRYDFAKEGSRNKLPPRDNLTLDAMDAERAGMSYGNYKALHPNTKDANEARLVEMNAPKEKKQYKAHQAYVRTCFHCGKQFMATRKNGRYCSLECKHDSDNMRWRMRYGKKKARK